MLLSLHVKNLALIREEEVEFGDGLNILTGETGAGKSLVIGSVNIALGAKAGRDIVRSGEDEAFVELVFDVKRQDQLEQLAAMDINPDDGLVILQRRIKDGRSIAKINGSTVTASVLKDISEMLIDIHGQHEHQSLLYKKNHLTILDDFAGSGLSDVLGEIADEYHTYRMIKDEISRGNMDDAELDRQTDLLRYEADEIEAAGLKEGEDAETETEYRRMKNSAKISEALSSVSRAVGYEMDDGAGNQIGHALMELKNAAGLDEGVRALSEELSEIDALLGDFNREISDNIKDMEFSDEDFAAVSGRLDLINHLKSKYGRTVEDIQKALEERRERLEQLNAHDEYMAGLASELEKSEKKLKTLSEKASGIRCDAAERLSELMKSALQDLNFLDAGFKIEVKPDEEKLSAAGYDDVEFMITLNPGEAYRPLAEVASGGELSRIMLALKTVLADEDRIDTLIFDEIDTGISGRTAQKVAEKLNILSRRHQVICITHLPQIAAMADHHFVISKSSDGSATETTIKELSGKEITDELSRLLSGAEITEAVRENASEMKKLADSLKHNQ